MIYTKLLTPAERTSAVKQGMYYGFISNGVPVSQIDNVMEKSGLDLLRWIVAGTLATGIPLGITAHIIGSKLKEKKLKEVELEQQKKFYQDTTGQIENSLSSSGAGLNTIR